MTDLEKLKLARYKAALPNITVNELMEPAIQADTFATDCGPFDPAFMTFVQQRTDLLNYAELLEKEQNQ